jgi:tRNA (uracil-5-)-methyltransferase
LKNLHPTFSRTRAVIDDPSWLRIGFNMINRNTTVDIEVGFNSFISLSMLNRFQKECPIAVPTINEKYKADRKEIAKYICTPFLLERLLINIIFYTEKY